MEYRRRRTRHHLTSLGRSLRNPGYVFQRDLQFTAALYPLGMAGYMAHVRSTEQFFADADSGNLPSFCIVDPDFRSFSEESPQDIRKGESFAAEVISRVMHGPAWADTLLIWTYDEHGGYYDHVAGRGGAAGRRPGSQPGSAPVSAAQPAEGAVLQLCPACRAARRGPNAYDNYGFRVPAVTRRSNVVARERRRAQRRSSSLGLVPRRLRAADDRPATGAWASACSPRSASSRSCCLSWSASSSPGWPADARPAGLATLVGYLIAMPLVPVAAGVLGARWSDRAGGRPSIADGRAWPRPS